MQKFNHIDLEEELVKFEPFACEFADEDNLGKLYAIDASITLVSAFDAIISKMKDEAEVACRASLSAVIRTVENESDAELDDEAMRQTELVEREVDFQVRLYELIAKNDRSYELCLKVLELIYEDGLSNIGLEFGDECSDMKDFIFENRSKAD